MEALKDVINALENGEKPIKIYAEVLELEAFRQFKEAMALPCNVAGALMPDAHTGYTLPIGAVVRSFERIFPSYVGYDIGCGMCAVGLEVEADSFLRDDLEYIKREILAHIPLGSKRHKEAQAYDGLLPLSAFGNEVFWEIGRFQLGTLGGGNHFIELGKDTKGKLWIVIHSGSRGFGKNIAEHYMQQALIESIDRDKIAKEFEAKNKEFKLHNPSYFEIAQQKAIQKEIVTRLKDIEGHYSFDIYSAKGKEYILDMHCALAFALENRKRMINKIMEILGNPKEFCFINKNHNHAILQENGYVLHRKGATSANLNEMGVIPGNMRDGSFIVRGCGNTESLCSSSHGAGRIVSRFKAKKVLSMEDFTQDMQGIVTNHSEQTIDEAPRAYKDIFAVMQLQEDMVEVLEHIRPILNIKG